MKHMAKYRALAKRYGLRYRVTKYYPQCAYSAKGVFNLVRTHVDHASHELAHYLVATPEQRQLREFGLGSTGYFADLSKREICAVDGWDASEIEGEASLLGIYIMLHLEGRSDAVDMYDRHTWDVFCALDTARDLLRKKLLIWHKGRLTPRCIVRPPRKSEIYVRP